MTLQRYSALRKYTSIDLVQVSELVETIRAIKEESEIETIKIAAFQSLPDEWLYKTTPF
ncbi:hypothetical protein WAG10_12030 [Bacillus cereus]